MLLSKEKERVLIKLFKSLIFTIALASIGPVSPILADEESFQAALIDLREGRFMAADKLFIRLENEDTSLYPNFSYFAAQTAFGTGHYRRAKTHIDTYLSGDTGNLLYQKEAVALKILIDQAVARNATSDAAAFELAQERGTIFAYAAYRRLYPEGQNVASADFLSYQRAKELNIEAAYLRYVENWPVGQYLTDAYRGADTALFRESRRQNTIQSYRIYQATYPQGVFQEQAFEREETLAFNKANRDASVGAIKLFLSQYPNGRNRAEAEKALLRAEEAAPRRKLTGPTAKIPVGVFVYKKSRSQNRPNIISIQDNLTAMAYEVTFEQWDACVADGGCNGYIPDDMTWGRGQRPVINVNRHDIDAFINWFNDKWQQAGGVGLWRLPSEAEWAYMARGLNRNVSVQRDAFDQAKNACTDCTNSADPNVTFPVGLYRQNSFGLFDLLSNAAEWVADCWHEDLTENAQDGSPWFGEGECTSGVVRGSVDVSTPVFLAQTARHEKDLSTRSPKIGFRLIRSP